MSRETAIDLGKRLLDQVRTYNQGVSIEHTATAVTRLANGSILDMDDGAQIRVSFGSACGEWMPIAIKTNQIGDALFDSLLSHIKTMAPSPPPPPKGTDVSDDPVDQAKSTYGPRTFPKVSLWHESTAVAMQRARADAIPALIEQLRASNLRSAATVGLVARSVLHLYHWGLVAFSDETDCEVTVTARTSDGTGSGWGGVAHRDWSRCTPSVAAERAISIAKQSQHPVALEPGRRTVILGPAAVAQLVYQMAELFDGQSATDPWGASDPRSGTPFTYRKADGTGRLNNLGLHVFDRRLMMTSDPADPDGGFAPFFNAGGKFDTVDGFPLPAITWIDRGVLTNLAWGTDAIDRRVLPADWPYAMRVFAAPGTQTSTVDEMIANCDDGVYVNRLSSVSVLLGERGTGMMTGVTRDGCFYVKHGKIERPIKNFQFIESPFLAFNRIEAIGTPERVPFGINAPTTMMQKGLYGRQPRWPRPPMIVPPLMIRDFNFSALSDAV